MGMQGLRVVVEGEQHSGAHAQEGTATERVFAHWVYMLGKNPRRCALGPTRRKLIDKQLGLYDEDTLMLAIEGCAASAWHAGANDREREFNDIELILRDEAHIERFAAEGEALRERLRRRLERQAEVVPIQAPDPVREAEFREKVRAMAQAARRGGR